MPDRGIEQAVLDQLKAEPARDFVASDIQGFDRNSARSALVRLSQKGTAVITGEAPAPNGGKPMKRFRLADNPNLVKARAALKAARADGTVKRRKRSEIPGTFTFEDLAAVAGVRQARALAQQIAVAKATVIMLSDRQVEVARKVASGEAESREMSAMRTVLAKFFGENPGSLRTFTTWLDALSKPIGDADGNQETQ